MDLNNLTTHNQKELLLLHILKSNLEIVENTHSKRQETLEFKMNTSQKDFQFDEPLILSGEWMMGVTNLEVYNTVYNINQFNNTFRIEIDPNIIHEILEIKLKPINELIEHKNYLSHSEILNKLKHLLKGMQFCDDDYIEFEEKVLNEFNLTQQEINSLNIKCTATQSSKDYYNVIIPPGIYEFIELSNCIQQLVQNVDEKFNKIYSQTEKTIFKIEPNTINMHCKLTTNRAIEFNSKLNEVLGFTEMYYKAGEHVSEKVINIMPINKIHLKCNCIDGSIVNGLREPILFTFSLDKAPGFKIFKEPKIILYKKLNTDKLSHIKFYLEDDSRNPVSFQGETLTFTIQLIKI